MWVQEWVVQLGERWEEWLWVRLLVLQLVEWLAQMWGVEQLAFPLESLWEGLLLEFVWSASLEVLLEYSLAELLEV